jgi:OOP family OmpA-OmpF porin
MKRLLLIPALLGTMAMAENYKYELSPMIGYNLAEGNLGLDNNGYFTGGIEFQINTNDSKISPEISLFYAPGVDYSTSGSTDIIRGAFNAVYTYEKQGKFIPFAKAGLGIENFTTNKAGNNDRLFVDTGIGTKMDLTDNLALKLEAIYMLKPDAAHAGNADSNLMALVGLTYSFGAQAQKETPAQEIEAAVVEEAAVIIAVATPVDSDGDGIVDADDKCADTPSNTRVDITGCPVILDTDNDGVADADDQCPNTAPDTQQVDAQGCKINPDKDNDGVLNAQDICPNTPANTAVDKNGCPATMTLDIKFENNSYKIKPESYAHLDKYATFLKKYPNYSAKIVGYTDSTGSAAYNKQLSKKRADEVVTMLKQRGVNAAQLSAEGLGEANPVADNATEAGRAQNRRIEAKLTHK